jgi:hypothetical protein
MSLEENKRAVLAFVEALMGGDIIDALGLMADDLDQPKRTSLRTNFTV